MSRIFGRPCQNGYVVRDIEAALKHWTEVLGIGPFFYFERVPVELHIAAHRRRSTSASRSGTRAICRSS